MKVKLTSGNELEITLAPFADGKSLYMAIAQELKGIDINMQDEIDARFFKDLVCVAVSSSVIESKIWECMKRCTYNGLKITQDTFEPEGARGDYLEICYEVAKENVRPFMKTLMQRFSPYIEILRSKVHA